jgi:hypothetical protein
MKQIVLMLGLLSSLSAQAANSIDYLNFSSQEKFSDFAKDLTLALDHKPMVPAEPLGVTGFDIGVAISNTKFSNSSLNNVDLVPVANALQMLNVQAHKGLPMGFDVGAAYSVGVGGNISTLAYEVSYAILDGSVALPAVAVKYTATSLDGVSVLSYKSSAFEIGVSKGFAILTPYAGIGLVSSTVDTDGSNVGANLSKLTLSKVTADATKTYIGVNVNLTAFDLLLDVTNIGDASTTSFKLGFRF